VRRARVCVAIVAVVRRLDVVNVRRRAALVFHGQTSVAPPPGVRLIRIGIWRSVGMRIVHYVPPAEHCKPLAALDFPLDVSTESCWFFD
jgi:hypothetical protein